MTTCKHADSGCNYPEGECLGECMDNTQECKRCEGDGEIPDPSRCLRCGFVGCHLIDCPDCKGTGRTAKATRSASHD